MKECGAMNNIKMVVVDLDDTLLKRDKTISAYSLHVFQRLHEQGILIALATARSYESAQTFHNALKTDADIVSGGCLVYAGETLLKIHHLPMPQTPKLLAELDAHTPNKRVSARSLERKYANIPVEGRLCVDFQSPFPDKLLHCSCRTEDDAFMQAIMIKYPEFSYAKDAGSNLYDINPKEATKLNGIREVVKHFNISLSEVIAFGDNHSDIEMLQHCGIGVAMSNAIDECKAVASFLCGDCDEDGVARWLDNAILS